MEIFNEFFIKKGFNEVSVNVTGISVFINKLENRDLVVMLFYMPQGNEWSKEQSTHIEEQVRSKLRKSDHELEMITFLITRQPEAVHCIYQANEHTGVVDLRDNRLLLFEGMGKEQLGIYQGLEHLLEELQHAKGQEEPSITRHRRENNTFLSRIKTVGKANLCIVLMNITIFAILELGKYQDEAVELGSLFWFAIDHNKEYYRLFTSMFLHGNLEHLLYNMLTLGVIGNTLEITIGKVKYLFVYILSGIVAALVSMRYNMEKELFVQSIGASGAIFGVIGALLLIVLLNKGRVEKLGIQQMLLFAALSLYGGFTSQGVDNVAHIGGLIAGFLLALIIYRKPKRRGVVS